MLPSKVQSKLAVLLSQSRFRVVQDKCFLFPDKVDEVSEIISLAKKHSFKIIPMGFGSTLPEVYCDVENVVYLSSQKMCKIIDFDQKNMFCEVESGSNILMLKSFLQKRGFDIPINVEKKSTVGGLISRLNQFTEFTDNIKGVTFVLPTSEKVKYGCKTLKNVAGLDFSKLVIGTFGSFGFITSVLFKVDVKNSFENNNFDKKDISLQYSEDFISTDLYKNLKNEIDPEKIFL